MRGILVIAGGVLLGLLVGIGGLTLQGQLESAAPEPTATALPRSLLPPSPSTPPPLTDSVPPDVLQEMDRLYPDYVVDTIILTDGPTMALYCRSAGYVQADENGFVKSVLRGDAEWLGRPVYQQVLPPPEFDAKRVDLLDFRPAADPLQLASSGRFDVHVDDSGNLVSGLAICRRIDEGRPQ